MPRVPEPHCPEPGCTNRGQCRQHGYRSRTAKKYNRREWRDLSARIRRDRPVCETQGCDRQSEHVDHIDGDNTNDAEWNLQALCSPCHSVKGHLSGELAPPARDLTGRHGTTHVTAVTGPPGAGKTTYVSQRSEPGDLIVDFDLIYAALSGLSTHHRHDDLAGFVLDARDAVLSRLEVRPGEVARAWIIHSAPRSEQRASLRARYDAHIVMLHAPRDVCVARLAARDVPGEDPAGIVDRWWQAYEPSPSDEVIRTGAAA